MRSLVFLLCLSLISISLHAEEKKEAAMSAPALADVKKALAENKAILVDVREKLEWDSGHLSQAALVPLSELKAAPDKAPKVAAVGDGLKLELAALPKDKPVYIHCKSGRRAITAAEMLKAQGYNVQPLKEGFDELTENGFEKSK